MDAWHILQIDLFRWPCIRAAKPSTSCLSADFAAPAPAPLTRLLHSLPEVLCCLSKMSLTLWQEQSFRQCSSSIQSS